MHWGTINKSGIGEHEALTSLEFKHYCSNHCATCGSMFCSFCFVLSNKNNKCNNNNNNNNNNDGKVFETNLNGGNIIKQMSIWEVSLLRYSAAFIYWNCEELIQLDQRTRRFWQWIMHFIRKVVLTLSTYPGKRMVDDCKVSTKQ